MNFSFAHRPIITTIESVQQKPSIFHRIRWYAFEIATTIVFLVFLYAVTKYEVLHLLGK